MDDKPKEPIPTMDDKHFKGLTPEQTKGMARVYKQAAATMADDKETELSPVPSTWPAWLQKAARDVWPFRLLAGCGYIEADMIVDWTEDGAWLCVDPTYSNIGLKKNNRGVWFKLDSIRWFSEDDS